MKPENWCACGRYNTTIYKMCLSCQQIIIANYKGPLPPKLGKEKESIEKLLNRVYKNHPNNAFVLDLVNYYKKNKKLSIRQIIVLRELQ
jgi:hypothetical protein